MARILVIIHLLLAVFCGPGFAAAGKRPNFVFFLLDDQPYLGMSCTGNTVLKTPGMDRLAAEGVLFEKSFVTTAICACSRACTYTGQHMRRHGVRDFQTPLSAAQFQQTFPALLRKAGYRTAFLGKYAIGAPEHGQEALPSEQFDLWYGFPQSIAFKQMVDGKPRYLTTVMTEKARAFLKDSKPDQPFCLIMAIKEPHGPRDFFDPEFSNPYADAKIPLPASLTQESFDALPPAVRQGLNGADNWLRNPARYEAEMRETYALIGRADLAVAQVCAALKERGLDDNTVVICTSDNGSFDGAHGLAGKWLMYEESIRVPLIVRDPRLPASTRGRRQQMALNIDLAPTILAMAGVPAPSAMQGMDLQPILRDPKAKGRQDWYYEHVYNTRPPRRPIPKSEGVRTERWKYIRYPESTPPLEQLFDLQADPGEERDLAGAPEHAEALAKLRARCDKYRVSLQ